MKQIYNRRDLFFSVYNDHHHHQCSWVFHLEMIKHNYRMCKVVCWWVCIALLHVWSVAGSTTIDWQRDTRSATIPLFGSIQTPFYVRIKKLTIPLASIERKKRKGRASTLFWLSAKITPADNDWWCGWQCSVQLIVALQLVPMLQRRRVVSRVNIHHGKGLEDSLDKDFDGVRKENLHH